MSSIIMRAAVPASLKAKQAGLPIEPEAMAQVIVATLTGSGTPSLEAAVRWGVPFFSNARRFPKERSHEFPLNAVIDRAHEVLQRAFAKDVSKRPADKYAWEAYATKLGSFAVDEVKAANLRLYTQKLLFAPEFSENGLRILKGLDQIGTKLDRASVAIANGEIPLPPSKSTKEHLLMLGPKRTYMQANQTLADWVAASKTLLLEFPLPDIEESDATRLDDYSTYGGGSKPVVGSAQLGLGFFLVRPGRHKPNARYPAGSAYLSTLAPVIFHRTNGDSAWSSHNFLTSTVQEYYTNGAYQNLEKHLHGRGRTFVATLKVCSACKEIYSPDRTDLQKRCNCAAV